MISDVSVYESICCKYDDVLYPCMLMALSSTSTLCCHCSTPQQPGALALLQGSSLD